MAVTLRLAAVFSDHMVLCRNQAVRIFGDAESGRKIVISIHDHTASCTAVKSKFEAVLLPMPHGGPYTMTVSDGSTVLTFTDILIGDVYLAGGQSNMEMMLKETQNAEDYIANADYPQIRYCNYPVLPYLDEKALAFERETKWHAVKPGECGNISAVAFHFSVKLQAELDIPVGIIGCYLGGTSIVSWLDEETLTATTGGKELLESFLKRIEGLTDEQYQKAFDTQQRDHAIWLRKADEIKAKNPSANVLDFIAELGPSPWPPPEGRKSAFRPCGLVNNMLKHIAPYTLTGMMYYQGESDFQHPKLYRALLMSLIALWRDLFKAPSLPFLNVQLPMYVKIDDPTGNSWAVLRQSQEQVYNDMRNTGLAVMIDGGEKHDIHPKDKKTVADRLFEQAQEVVYHQKADVSPKALLSHVENNEIIVSVSAPLAQQESPRLFELAAEDMVFRPADAVVNGTEIRVSSKEVILPYAVRYAWVNYGEVNVFGENGLPLAPFQLN